MAKKDTRLSLNDSNLSLKLNDLSNPLSLEKTFLELFNLLKGKRVIGLTELNILLDKTYTKEEIAEQISGAILLADEQKALELWNMCSSDLKHTMILPDTGKIDLAVVNKLEIEGGMIRSAFLSRKNFPFPKKTAYSEIFGDCSYEAAQELAFILEQIWNSGIYGKVIAQEFFHEIDLRFLYLLGIKEIEQFLEDGGEDVYLAIKTNDQLPMELNLLCWLQYRLPEKYKELIPELINPIYPENRNIFWETFFRMNLSHVDPDYYSQQVNSSATYDGGNHFATNSGGEPSGEELCEDQMDNNLKIED